MSTFQQSLSPCGLLLQMASFCFFLLALHTPLKAQNQITIGSPTTTSTVTRAPIQPITRHQWSNILLVDSALSAHGLPSNVWIDSIAFFKSTAGHPALPFALGMWLGPANQTDPFLPADSWDNFIIGKTEVLRDSAFRLDNTIGEIVFRFSQPYPYWSNGLQIATRSDFGPLPAPTLNGGTLFWKRYSYGWNNTIVHTGTTNTFNSWEMGLSFSNTFPVTRIYYRNRLARDLGIKSLVSPGFPILQDSTALVKVRVLNEGTTALSSAQLSYQLNQGSSITQTFSFNLPPDSAVELSFSSPIQIPQSNQFNIKVWVNSVNGGLTDLVATNDTLAVQLRTAITADTVWVGQQHPFSNLQQVFDQLMAGGNTQSLTVMLGENQTGNFSLHNFSVPENRRVNLTAMTPNIGIESLASGPLLHFQQVEGVSLFGLRFQHQMVVDTSDYLFLADESHRLELRGNHFVGSAGSTRNYLVMARNCNLLTADSNLFVQGSKALVSTSTLRGKTTFLHHIVGNRFSNQSTRAIHYYGSSVVDSLLIEANMIHNNELPTTNACGIEVSTCTRLNLHGNGITGHIGLYGMRVHQFFGDISQPNRIINNVISGNFVNPAGNALLLVSSRVFPDTTSLNYVHVDHNSFQIKLDVAPTFGFGPLRVASGISNVNTWSGMTIRNNLMMIAAPASAINTGAILTGEYIELTRPGVEISHNHYHVPGHAQVRRRTNASFATLTDWRTTYPSSEIASNTGDPLLIGAFNDNLRPNLNSPVAGNGLPIAAVRIDHDGNLRDSIPDCGAFEAQPLTNSTHLYQIVSPAANQLLLHDSNYVLSVLVRNTGGNTLDSMRFSYLFGYRDTVNTIWTGSLAPGDSLLFSFPQPLRVRSDSMDLPDLQVWTNTIGGLSSPNAALDSQTAFYCTRIPAGTYVVREPGSTSSPLASWLRLLNCGGITGPVVLKTNFSNKVLLNPIIELSNIQGLSATSTLVLDGQGDTLRANGTNTQPTTLSLLNIGHVRVQHFVFDGLNASANSQIWLSNVDSVDLLQNHFIGNFSNSLSYGIMLSSQANGLFASRSTALRIDSNQFLGGLLTAILIQSGTNAVSSRLRVENNHIRSYFGGISLAGIDTGWVAFNDISLIDASTNASDQIGLRVAGTNGALQIYNNRIHTFSRTTQHAGSSSRGMSLLGGAFPGKRVLVFNNLIYNISNPIQTGIFISSSIPADLANNTIYINDNLNTGIAIGINIDGSQGGALNLVNNNVVIDKAFGEWICALNFGSASLPANLSANYNNYFVRYTSPVHSMARSFTTNIPTFAAYRQAYPNLDVNSSYADPFFENAATALFTPNATALYRNGQALSYVTTDFNGNIRPATPSRGALEDSILPREIGFNALNNINNNNLCNLNAPINQLASFFNLGSSTIDSVVIWYKQNQNPWVRDTAIYALAGRQQIDYVLGRGTLMLTGNDTMQATAQAYYGNDVQSDSLLRVLQNVYQTAFSLPFLNSYETPLDLNNLCITQNTQSLVQVSSPPQLPLPLIGQGSLTMSATNSATGWSFANASNAWSQNPSFFSEVSFFVHPGRIGPLRLAMRFQAIGSTGHNFFRVLVNGVPITPVGINNPTLDHYSGLQRSLLYLLDSINTGDVLKISLQSSVRYGLSHSTRHANVIDSLSVFFGPDVVFSDFTYISDTLCAPTARQIQVNATPNIGSIVSTVNLHYAAVGGSWNSVPMTPGTTPNTYAATLPALPTAQQIRYAAVAPIGTQNWTTDTAKFSTNSFDVDLGPNRQVVIGQSTTLKPLIVNAGLKTLRITELMYLRATGQVQPSFPTGIAFNHDDMIEIANYGDDTVDLHEAELAISTQTVGLISYRFPVGSFLPPKGHVVVVFGTPSSGSAANNIYFLIPPLGLVNLFLSNQTVAVVLREAGSKQVVDGVLTNANTFPSQLNYPAGIWTGTITGSSTSGIKRANINQFDSQAWTLNSTTNPTNIGTIDSSFRVGPSGQQIRWKDASGNLVATGDSLVLTPISNTLMRVEVDWYGCSREDSVNILLVMNNQVDLAITSITNPPAVDTMAIGAPFTPSVWVKNLTNVASGSFTVDLLANGSVVATATSTQGLGAHDSLLLNLSAWMPQQASYDLCFRLTNALDINPSNNILCRNNIYFLTSLSVGSLSTPVVQVYPIPAKNQLFVQLSEDARDLQHDKWQAVDATGRAVPLQLRSEGTAGLIELQLGHLSNGIYYLQNASNARLARIKFVVMQ